MKTAIKEYQAGPDYKPNTWVWIKQCWRPVKSYRTIKRGKRKGWIVARLFYPEGRTVTVHPTCVKFAKKIEGDEK